MTDVCNRNIFNIHVQDLTQKTTTAIIEFEVIIKTNQTKDV